MRLSYIRFIYKRRAQANIPINMDKSNGYERIAKRFIETRGQIVNGIGTSSVRDWAQTLPEGSTVLDLGCGTGVPISRVLTDVGMSALTTRIHILKIPAPELSNTQIGGLISASN